MWLDAPTVRTHGALPGAVMPPYCGWPCASRPGLPAAATTTMPASTARLAASVSGSVVYGLVHAGGDREVDHADVERGAVRDRVVDGRDDVADVAVAGAVERLEHDELGAGRDAAARAVRVEAVAGDDARDVRAVAVVVVGEDWPLTKSAKWTMRRSRSSCHAIDAGINGGDADVQAGDAEVLGDPSRAGGGRRQVERAADGAIEADAGNFGPSRELVERGVGHDGRPGPEPREVPAGDAVDRLDQRCCRLAVERS